MKPLTLFSCWRLARAVASAPRKSFALMAILLTVISFSSSATAAVTGKIAEVFGNRGEAVTFDRWIGRSDALITPELIELAAQSCFRTTQQKLDVKAYALTHEIAQELGQAYPAASTGAALFPKGLSSLAGLVGRIEALGNDGVLESPGDYSLKCHAEIDAWLQRDRSALLPLYEGRLDPKPDPSLARRGLEVVPLTWETLGNQICDLEGYYSEIRSPDLWRFFSISRALGNVLPSEENDEEFRSAVLSSPALVRAIARLGEYSSVAGKPNGAAIGMSKEERESAPPRRTGPAAGSRATALLATYTTAWRERLQWLTMTRPYPQSPFALLSADEVMRSLSATYQDVLTRSGRGLSPTEIGMTEVWESLADTLSPPGANHHDAVYGPETAHYRQAASLAWLALNAEANLRQNEKIPGVRYTSDTSSTRLVFGSSAYASIANEISAAMAHYEVVEPDPARLPSCLGELGALAKAAGQVRSGQVSVVTGNLTDVLSSLRFDPVYADIGLEVEDNAQGPFRLGLATGYGHITTAIIEGNQYALWAPAAMVLHRPTVVTTAEWKHNLVWHYDRLQ